MTNYGKRVVQFFDTNHYHKKNYLNVVTTTMFFDWVVSTELILFSLCSKNSLDENTIEPTIDTVDHRALEPNNHYDEQEMSLEMYNDEFDHFNKVPPSKMADSDLYLKAALQEHDVAQQQQRAKNMTNRSNHSNHTNRSNHSNKTNRSNHRNKPPPPPPPPPYKGLSNGKLVSSKMNGIDKNIYSVSNNFNHSPLPKKSASKNKSHDGTSNKHTYDNEAYTGDISEPYITRNVDGLQTTDI